MRLRLCNRFTFSEADHRQNLPSILPSRIECDLILLDLLLPGGDGFSILQRVREVRPTLPVIILTARGDESDRVKGLQLGADDYVVKPFSIKELVARIRAVLRRSPGRPLDLACVRFPETGVEADLFRRELRFSKGDRAELSEKEVELLRYLAANPDRAISREELLRCVWRIDPHGAATRVPSTCTSRACASDCCTMMLDQPRLIADR